MSALPVYNTARLVAHYAWRGNQSRVQYRFQSGTSATDAADAVDTFHDAIKAHMFTNWTALAAAEWYPSGSHISVPVALVGVSAGTGGTDTEALPDAFQLEALGRDLDGRKVSWYFQGPFVGLPTNQRLLVGDYPAVTSIVAGLQDMITAGLSTIGGAAPVLKNYVNCVVNDYLTRRARRG